MRNAASGIRSLVQERASLQAYSFPSRSIPAALPSTNYQPVQQSPISQWTSLNTATPHGNSVSAPVEAQPAFFDFGGSFSPTFSSFAPSSWGSSTASSISHSLPCEGLPMSLPMSLPESLPPQSILPQNIMTNTAISMPYNQYVQPTPTQFSQSMPQALPQSCGLVFSNTPTFPLDQSALQQQNLQQQMPFFTAPLTSPDLSIPSDLFFDNLCM